MARSSCLILETAFKASAEDHKKKPTTPAKENIVKQALQLKSNRLLRNRKRFILHADQSFLAWFLFVTK